MLTGVGLKEAKGVKTPSEEEKEWEKEEKAEWAKWEAEERKKLQDEVESRKKEREEWKELLQNLAPLPVSAEGWLEEWEGVSLWPSHRHLSPLYPIFPGEEIHHVPHPRPKTVVSIGSVAMSWVPVMYM